MSRSPDRRRLRNPPTAIVTQGSGKFTEAAIIIEVENALSAGELAKLDDMIGGARFVDGRITNPHNQTKQNLQIEHGGNAHKSSAELIAGALMRNEAVNNYAFMKRVAPPLVCRYRPGMKYGKHADAAYLPLQPPLRSDISCTVFLTEPESYQGGALSIITGDRSIDVKAARGSAVLYPSTSIHEVKPVSAGERIVAITFIESQIRDEKKREILYSLNEVTALEGLSMQHENRISLEHISHNLHRMWSH